jgi:hypothetical protein
MEWHAALVAARVDWALAWWRDGGKVECDSPLCCILGRPFGCAVGWFDHWWSAEEEEEDAVQNCMITVPAIVALKDLCNSPTCIPTLRDVRMRFHGLKCIVYFA